MKKKPYERPRALAVRLHGPILMLSGSHYVRNYGMGSDIGIGDSDGSVSSAPSAFSASSVSAVPAPPLGNSASSRRSTAPLATLLYGTAASFTESTAVGAVEADDFSSDYYGAPTDSIMTDPATSLLQD